MISIESHRAAIGKWHIFCIVRPLIDTTKDRVYSMQGLKKVEGGGH